MKSLDRLATDLERMIEDLVDAGFDRGDVEPSLRAAAAACTELIYRRGKNIPASVEAARAATDEALKQCEEES